MCCSVKSIVQSHSLISVWSESWALVFLLQNQIYMPVYQIYVCQYIAVSHSPSIAPDAHRAPPLLRTDHMMPVLHHLIKPCSQALTNGKALIIHYIGIQCVFQDREPSRIAGFFIKRWWRCNKRQRLLDRPAELRIALQWRLSHEYYPCEVTCGIINLLKGWEAWANERILLVMALLVNINLRAACNVSTTTCIFMYRAFAIVGFVRSLLGKWRHMARTRTISDIILLHNPIPAFVSCDQLKSIPADCLCVWDTRLVYHTGWWTVHESS